MKIDYSLGTYCLRCHLQYKDFRLYCTCGFRTRSVTHGSQKQSKQKQLRDLTLKRY